MGKIACATGDANTADLTALCPGTRVLLKGSLSVQQMAMTWAVDYLVAFTASCAKNTDATVKDACVLEAYKGFKTWGTAMATANVYSKLTAAERITWFTAEDVKNNKAALDKLKPAPGVIGAGCGKKSPMVMQPGGGGGGRGGPGGGRGGGGGGPGSPGGPGGMGRPACAAGNCCMGYKAAAADLVNSEELCQLATATKGQVITTAATAKSTSNYVEVTAAVFVEQTGVCIEGAVRAATAAFSVLAATYMMV